MIEVSIFLSGTPKSFAWKIENTKKVKKRRKEEERLSNLLHTMRRYMAGAFLHPYKILKISDNAYYYILYKQIAAHCNAYCYCVLLSCSYYVSSHIPAEQETSCALVLNSGAS